MYLSIENTPIFSLSGKYIWNYLLLGNSFINDTFLTSDECVKDLDSKCLFIVVHYSFLFQSKVIGKML